MDLFGFKFRRRHDKGLFRRRHDEGTTIESPIVAYNVEMEVLWVHDFHPEFRIVDHELVDSMKGYWCDKLTLETSEDELNEKETRTLYFKLKVVEGVDLDEGTTIESPIVVESVEAEYDWIRRNRPYFRVFAQALIMEESFSGDKLTARNMINGETVTLYFSFGQSSLSPEARERLRSKIREELDEMRQAHQKGKSSSIGKVEPKEYEDDKRHGQGTSTDPDGTKYVGEYKDGKKHGQGTYTWPDGDKYVGEWEDDKWGEHGQGTYTCADGAKYVGEWKDGISHGQGTQIFVDGSKYVGEWEDGKKHGQGAYTWPNGDKYVGEYKDNKMHGQGTHIWPDGTKYVGEYMGGKMHGQGTLIVSDDRKYVGEFKDDKMHGQGTFTNADGTKYVGEWKDAKKWSGTEYDRGDKVVSIWSDGEISERQT